MNEINLFSAAVRILGLYSAARGFSDLLYSLLIAMGIYDIEPSVARQYPSQTFVYGIVFLLVGIYLIKGAPLLIDFAFPASSREQLSDDEESDEQDTTDQHGS